MQKKVSIFFTSIAFLAMLGGVWVTSTAQKGPLKDISGTTYENAINYLLENGVVEGYDDGTYKPNKTINRAELLKIILEASDADFTNASKSCFPDVSGDDWYVKYVCTAQKLGIVEGYSDGTFKPAQTVNFVEALKITLLGYNLDVISDTDPWYKGYVDTASGFNLIPLEISAFGADLSRGQMADLITRLNKYKEGTQEDYLISSFGSEYKKVISYEIIESRQANKTSVAPANLPTAKIKTFSSHTETAKKMNFTPSLKESSDDVLSAKNYNDVLSFLELDLSQKEKDFLNENKFVLIPIEKTKFKNIDTWSEYDEMLGPLDQIGGEYNEMGRKSYNTKLITTDAVLHTFHKFFENTLEKLEKEELGEKLREFNKNLQDRAFACMESSTNSEIKERCENISAQITVSRILLENAKWNKPEYFEGFDDELNWEESDKTIDNISNAKKMLDTYKNKFSEEIFKSMERELADIYLASSVGKSPLFSQYNEDIKTDYTQFTPRSHYTKTSSLRAYFRTMIYLGRNSYIFGNELGVKDSLILAWLMSSKEVLEPWRDIMTITGFYAGESDDITYNEWRNYIVDLFGDIEVSGETVNDVNMDKLIMNLHKLEPPKILSDIIVTPNISELTKDDLLDGTKGFRIFGQRFSYDAWILNQLTSGEEKSDLKLPSTPSALFVNAVMGDDLAKIFAGDFLMEDAGFSSMEIENFNKKIDSLRVEISKVKDSEWLMSMGSAWLEVLGSLTNEYGKGYPMFMQNSPYLIKQIQTFLGSYTELKHDTLLYAKQSYAELGAGFEEGDVPPIVKGFVEPNMEFWYKTQKLISYTIKGFEENDLLSDQLYKLELLEESVDLYTKIAEKELKGEKITDEEYESLRTDRLEWIAEPMDKMGGMILDEEEKRTSLIADIHTDGVRAEILYEAVARPYIMVVFISNENSPRLATGVAYNHYELTGPLGGERYSDESWEEWVYEKESKMPKKNFWYNNLIAK